MTSIEKSLLDVIAYAEGTLGVSQNGYDVVVTFKTIVGWTKDTDIIHGDGDWLQVVNNKLKSTASGRYQFLGSTWKSINGKRNLPMTKDNQDNAALKLINIRLKSTSVDKRGIKIDEIKSKEKFNIFLQKCAPEWASLPLTKKVILKNKEGGKTTREVGQGYYGGQSSKEGNELWDVFKKAYGFYIQE